MNYKCKFIIYISLLIFGKIYSDEFDESALLIYNFIRKKEFVEVLNDLDISKYLYIQNLSDVSKLERKMPNYNFTECLNMIKENNNNINDLSDIYIFIIELNNQKSVNGKFDLLMKSINTTIFKFFTSNFRNEGFLDYSICNNMEIEVSKRVETRKIDYQEIKEIAEKYKISLFKNETKFNDYCSPLNINNKDLTVYDRQMLMFKNVKPCDEGCTFISFNLITNYSTCLCKAFNEDKEINLLNEFYGKIKENDWFEKLYQLLDKGNWKYLNCYNQIYNFINKKEKFNWIRIISFLLIISQAIFMRLYYKISEKGKNDGSNEKKENIKHEDIMKEDNKEEDNKEEDKKEEHNKNEITKIEDNKEEDNKEEDNKEEDNDEKRNNNKIIKYKRIDNLPTIDDKEEITIKNLKITKTSSNYFIISSSIIDIKSHDEDEKVSENEYKSDEKDGVKTKKNNKDSENKIIPILKTITYLATSIKMDQENDSLYNELIINILSIHNFIFFNAFLFSDKFISKRYYLNNNNEFKYLLSKEFDRIFLVFVICKIINRILLFFLDVSKDNLVNNIKKNKIEEEYIFKNNSNENIPSIEFQSTNNKKKSTDSFCNKCKIHKVIVIIIHSLIIVIQLLYLYFFVIFGNVNPNIQIPLLLSSLISFLLYMVVNSILNGIKYKIEECSIKGNNCCTCFYKIIKEI